MFRLENSFGPQNPCAPQESGGEIGCVFPVWSNYRNAVSFQAITGAVGNFSENWPMDVKRRHERNRLVLNVTLTAVRSVQDHSCF